MKGGGGGRGEEPGIRGGGQRRGSEAESQRRGVRLG